MWQPDKKMSDNFLSASPTTDGQGLRSYELTNHLGNVLATINDKGSVVSAQDYTPFGMSLVGRTSNTEGYRFGFNGKEYDAVFKTIDFGERRYRADLGRFTSVDPLRAKSPDMTPYRFGFNNSTRYKDPDGRWEEDGHFWTVYAFGMAAGLTKQDAYSLAVRAEYYDHYVHQAPIRYRYTSGISMQIHPLHENSFLGFGENFGLGTWADDQLQDYNHGLNGKLQSVQLNDAKTRVLSGFLDQIHTIGDSWAHSYVDGNGIRRMYGGEDTKWWIPGLGWITPQHAFSGPPGHDDADNIQKRPVEYAGYIGSLEEVYKSRDFVFSDKVTKGQIDKSIFDYVQKNGRNKYDNAFLFNAFVDYKSGQKTFYDTGDGSRLRLFRDYLKSKKIESTLSCDGIDTSTKYYSLTIKSK